MFTCIENSISIVTLLYFIFFFSNVLFPWFYLVWTFFMVMIKLLVIMGHLWTTYIEREIAWLSFHLVTPLVLWVKGLSSNFVMTHLLLNCGKPCVWFGIVLTSPLLVLYASAHFGCVILSLVLSWLCSS